MPGMTWVYIFEQLEIRAKRIKNELEPITGNIAKGAQDMLEYYQNSIQDCINEVNSRTPDFWDRGYYQRKFLNISLELSKIEAFIKRKAENAENSAENSE